MQSNPSNQMAENSIEVKSQPEVIVQKNNSVAYSVLAFPVVILLGIVVYKRYRVVVHKRRIAMLEKIWLLNVNRKIR